MYEIRQMIMLKYSQLITNQWTIVVYSVLIILLNIWEFSVVPLDGLLILKYRFFAFKFVKISKFAVGHFK
jgi:hypothetical protein